jgi:hypothetical protein
MLSLLLSHHIAKRATCLPCRQTKRRRPQSRGRLPSAWDGRDREAKIFLESVLLLKTSSRTAGADLDSGHKMEPAQKKVVIASGLLPFLNHEAKAYAFKPLGHALPARCPARVLLSRVSLGPFPLLRQLRPASPEVHLIDEDHSVR